jgi:CheY-like chemotaxis protein
MTGSLIILAVDCNQRNLELLAKLLDRAGYLTLAVLGIVSSLLGESE